MCPITQTTPQSSSSPPAHPRLFHYPRPWLGRSSPPASARAGEVRAGKEVAPAPADDEEVAHLELLLLVEVEEGVVDGRRTAIEGVEVGQHLRHVLVGDFVDALHRAVGALDLLEIVKL